MSYLQQAFELYTMTDHYNGQHLMSLTKFRKFAHECGLVDGRRVKPGDLDVVFHQVLTEQRAQAGNDRVLMTLSQFHDAVRSIASKIYASTIEQMTGKRMSSLIGAERDAALDASLEVFIQQHLVPFVEEKSQHNATGLDSAMQQQTMRLNQPTILRNLELQLKSLSQLYSFYCESQRARSNPHAVRDRTRHDCHEEIKFENRKSDIGSSEIRRF